jgi:metal-responsive CopG/Arc/MetJ family transcriptional regulator
MRTIQITLDDNLVKAVDRVAKELKTNRSAFIRKALQEALIRYNLEQLEKKHRRGYEQYPVAVDEFSAWEPEQAWGDE